MIKRRDFLKFGSLLGIFGIPSLSSAEKKEDKKVGMQKKSVKRYDEKGNLIHFKAGTSESWYEYDDKGRTIYYENYAKITGPMKVWSIYYKNYRYAHYNINGVEQWCKYDKNKGVLFSEIKITKKEYKEIESRMKEKEYLSREK